MLTELAAGVQTKCSIRTTGPVAGPDGSVSCPSKAPSVFAEVVFSIYICF